MIKRDAQRERKNITWCVTWWYHVTRKTWVESRKGVQTTDLQKLGTADRGHVRVKRGRVTWDQWAGVWKVKCIWLKNRSSKSERRYWFVVRLKAIEYKEDFLCYLCFTTSLHLHSPFIIFVSRDSLPNYLRMCKFHLLHRLTTPSGPHYQDISW